MYNRGFFGGTLAAAAALATPMTTNGGRRSGAPKGYRIIHRLNRSQRWPRAHSYKHAREISPFPDRHVR